MDVLVKLGHSSSNGFRDIHKPSCRKRHVRPFSNIGNFRPEVYIDVITRDIVEPAGVKVGVKFGDST